MPVPSLFSGCGMALRVNDSNLTKRGTRMPLSPLRCVKVAAALGVMSSESESVKVTDSIEVEITGREASLILKYGYPFPDQATAFEKVAGKKGYHRVTIGEFWLEIIVGDLCRSIKEVRSLSLQEELDALCDSLETAMGNSGSGGF